MGLGRILQYNDTGTKVVGESTNNVSPCFFLENEKMHVVLLCITTKPFSSSRIITQKRKG